MPRKIVVESEGAPRILVETRAEDEAQLQEMVKKNPDLLPIEEFGMTGPLLVVGRETALPSGAVDLAAIARSGEILIAEFKTGPDNSDFRRALAQLLDYGSHVWSLTYDEFEATVPARYFASGYCEDSRLRGLRSLEDAAKTIWPEMADDDLGEWRDRIVKQLESGIYHYVLVAQRFTTAIQKTAQYLNQVMPGPRTYAVEIVRFQGDGVEAFETRTVLKPAAGPVGQAARLDEDKFLEQVGDPRYREFLSEIFETCRGLGYRFEWGTTGVSIRLPTEDKPDPLTVSWIFLPGRSGWMGLTDVNFGFDSGSADQTPSSKDALEKYVASIGRLQGAGRPKAKNLKDTAWHFSASDAMAIESEIKECFAQLISQISGMGD